MPKDYQKEIAKHPEVTQYLWMDTHTHINFLEEEPEEVLSSARQSGVKRFITIGTEPKDWPDVLKISKKYFPEVASTIGLHPHEAKLYTPELGETIKELSLNKEVVALGEMGLDYYYNHSSVEEQKEAFAAQLVLAQETGLPVEIHTRDAEEDTVELLKSHQGVTGLLHCFTGSLWMAKQALDLGLNISLSGVLTFKKAEELRAVADYVPLDRLHIETDAPWLAPAPFRGETNAPKYVVFTALQLAAIKQVSLEELSDQLFKNAQKLFQKWQLD